MTEIITEKDESILAERAVQILSEQINLILGEKDKVVLAIPGGRSVQGIFKLLSKEDIPWSKIHIFMVDERLVHLDDKESNFRLATESFIDKLIQEGKLPEENVHPFKFEEGIEAYEGELKKLGGKFDCIILGVGEDGHVAALFPHLSINDDSEYFLTLENSPKPPKQRMTSSRKLLEKAEFAIALFIGKGKKDAFNNYKNKTIDDCPAKLIDEIDNAFVLTD